MRVTQQQALGLREIGYVTIYPTDVNGNRFGTDSDYLPHIYDAIEWMRDVKGVHVCPEPNFEYIASQWIYEIFIIKGKDWSLFDSMGSYPTHDLAQSAGLDAAIEYVKKQQNKL